MLLIAPMAHGRQAVYGNRHLLWRQKLKAAEGCGGTQAGNVGHVGDVSGFPPALFYLSPLPIHCHSDAIQNKGAHGRREKRGDGKPLTSLTPLTWRRREAGCYQGGTSGSHLIRPSAAQRFAPGFAGDPSTGLAAPVWVGKMKRAGSA
jgi:hypothetical protein